MKKNHIYSVIFIILSTLFAYINSLNGTWALDDVVANKPISINDIYDFIGFRKIAYFTFYLNQLISPFSPVYFRIVNIFIHLTNSILVYVIAYKSVILLLNSQNEKGFLKIDNRHKEKKAFYVALFSGIIFALHPINTNAVTYIVQRMASLATFFVLLSLLFYILGAEAKKKINAIILYILSVVFIIMGVFSKENAILSVPLILLYDFIILSYGNKKGFYKRLLIVSSLGIITIVISFIALQLQYAFLGILNALVEFNKPIIEKGWTATDVYWTPLQHILTEFRVIVRYLILIFFPSPKLMVFDWWSYPISKGLFTPLSTFLSMLVVFSMAIIAVILRNRLPLLSFGILWYLLAISLESFVALGSDLYFEHRNYLPISGLIIGLIGQTVVSIKISGKKSIFLILCALSLVLGALTIIRNSVWKDSLTLWKDTLKKDSSNIRALLAIGNTYFKTSDLSNAEKYYLETIRLSSYSKRAHFLDGSVYSLGFIYLYSGRFEQAKELIDKYESLLDSYKPKILKGFYKSLKGDLKGAIEEYNNVINKAEGIDKIVLLTLLGDAYRGLGEYHKAIEKYEKALKRDPSFSAAIYGKGLSFIGLRNLDLAEKYLYEAISVDPYNVLAYADLSDLLIMKRRDLKEALVFAEKGVAFDTPFYQPYLSMGNILIILGREKEAQFYYDIALSKGAKEYMIIFSKARIYFIKGDNEKVKYYLTLLRGQKDLPEGIKKIIK